MSDMLYNRNCNPLKLSYLKFVCPVHDMLLIFNINFWNHIVLLYSSLLPADIAETARVHDNSIIYVVVSYALLKIQC